MPTIYKSGAYHLKYTDSEITISTGTEATVTVFAPPTYTIAGKASLVVKPSASATLSLSFNNWAVSGKTEWLKNRITQDSEPLVTSVFGRVGDVVAANGDYTASQITNVPTAPITGTDVQTAIDELAAIAEGGSSIGFLTTSDLTYTFDGTVTTENPDGKDFRGKEIKYLFMGGMMWNPLNTPPDYTFNTVTGELAFGKDIVPNDYCYFYT